MKPVRLWMFNHYAVPPGFPGGTRHYDLARHLLDHGVSTTIFASDFNHYLRRGVDRPRHETILGVDWHWVPTPAYRTNNLARLANILSYSSLAPLEALQRLAIKRLPRPDVIMGSSVHMLAVADAWMTARVLGARFIMEVRDLWPDALMDRVGHRLLPRLALAQFRAVTRFLYHRANHIVVLLEHASRLLAQYGIPPERVTWIPNGVDLSRFADLQPTSHPAEGFQVVFTGSLVFGNYIETLLKAAQLVQEQQTAPIRFHIYGDGHDKPRLVEAARELGLDNTTFHDAVSKEEIIKVLGKADVLWCGLRNRSIYQYGISLNKMYDYMAAGKPILFSTDLPDTAVERAGAGFILPSDDAQQLAERIGELYAMVPEERAALGARGRAYVEQHHSMQVLASRYNDVIRGVL